MIISRTRVVVVVVAIVVLAAASLLAAPQPQAPGAGKRVLMVWGGWPGHQPKETVEIFAPWLKEQGFEVEIADSVAVYKDPAKMKGLALIVQAVTMGQLGREEERGLLEAVRGGAGLAGWHGGLADSFRANTEYEFMVGGAWVAHPGNILEYEVTVTDHRDPITRGLANFRMKSEQYYMLVDPNTQVLATTTFSGVAAPWIKGAVMPVVWKKLYGNGRVFNTTLGHVASDFGVPEARTIVQRGLLWAARVPGAGDDPVPTNPYK